MKTKPSPTDPWPADHHARLTAAVDDLLRAATALKAELATAGRSPLNLVVLTGEPDLPNIARAAIREAAMAGGTTPEQISGRSRPAAIVRLRWTAYWLIRQCAPAASLNAIGRHFNNRDHNTIKHGLDGVEHRRLRDADYRAALDKLAADLAQKLAA